MADPVSTAHLLVSDFTDARWEVIDTHRCTKCGYVAPAGPRMIRHLWTHVSFACDMTTPASESGRCWRCGWLGPGSRSPACDLSAEHEEHMRHSAYVRTLCHPRCSGPGLHHYECAQPKPPPAPEPGDGYSAPGGTT